MRMATQPPAGGSAAWGDLIAQRARGVADSIARAIAYPAITPNLLTVLGFVLTGGVALVIGQGYELLGGLLVIVAGLFDMLDGAMARVSGRKTRFGAFLDSTLDRCSEAVLLAGVLWLYHSRNPDDPWMPMLVLWVLAGSLLVSYARARAEVLDVNCEVGWAQRPQRVVVLAAGLILAGALERGVYVTVALGVLAVFTTITTLQRILHTRRELEGR
jgi:CDP-diacylglycerol--glycerol-3-phosphate 3-phosphatidyltransferase